MVDEALGVPGDLGRGGGEQGGGLVEIGEAEVGGAAGGERGKAVETLAGETAERHFEQGGLEEREVGVGRQVVGEAGLGGIEPEAGRGGERDAGDLFAGALGDGIEGADFLKIVAEEIEPVGLRGGDRVDVDDAAADGVVSGRFADGLGVVVEGAELLEEAGEGERRAAGEGELAGGERFKGGHRLEEGGRGGDDQKLSVESRELGAGRGAEGAQAGEDGEPVGGGGEGLAHVAGVGLGLGKNQHAQRRGAGRGGMEEGDVFCELLGGLELVGDHEPDRRGAGAHEFGEHGAAGGGTDAGEL